MLDKVCFAPAFTASAPAAVTADLAADFGQMVDALKSVDAVEDCAAFAAKLKLAAPASVAASLKAYDERVKARNAQYTGARRSS